MGTFSEFKENRYLFKSIIFYLSDVILICFLLSSFQCVKLKQTEDMDPLYSKFNQMIATPPSFEQLQISQIYFPEGNNNFNSMESSNKYQHNGAYDQSQGLTSYPSNPSSHEEFVFVPTPVDPEYYETMKKEKNNQMINLQNFANFQLSGDSTSVINNSINNKLSIDSQPLLEPKFLDTNFLKTSTETNIIPGDYENKSPGIDQYPGNIQKLINLQKKDYEKYFNTLNNLEYQKVYQNLNQNKLNEEMKIRDSLVDYNKVLNMDISNLLKNKTQLLNVKNFNENLNSTSLIVDLPTNKMEVIDLYSKLYSKINKNNSLSFVQLDKNIVLENGKAPMYGSTDAKVRKIIPKVIGIPNKKDLNPKDYDNKVEESERKRKEKKAIENEMDRRSRDNYPRFRRVYPQEKSDEQEMVYINELKKREFKKLKNKIEAEGEKNTKTTNSTKQITTIPSENIISHSFIQEFSQDPENKMKMLDAIDIIIQKRNKEKNEKARLNLANCQRNCDGICERATTLKNESEELCKTKCYLACSQNTLNNLFK